MSKNWIEDISLVSGAANVHANRLLKPAHFSGTGLHSGVAVSLDVLPGIEGAGIVFERTDIATNDRNHAQIVARYDNVTDTQFHTLISNAHGVSVSTIEHLMAALSGLAIRDALIRLNGPEVPIMDGSSLPFLRGLLQAGLAIDEQSAHILRVTRPFEIETDTGAIAGFRPADNFKISFEIQYDEAAIGTQSYALDMANGAFLRELADCRTFCRLSEVEALKANGLAKGGSLDNAVVFDGDKILNPEGLRREKESVRHKMLDALGDLSLAGAPIIGEYYGIRAGHSATNALLRAAFAAGDVFERVSVEEHSVAALLPGTKLTQKDIDALQFYAA